MAEEFDWGNFLNKAAERGADTLGNMIDSAARGGSVVSILGSGLSGALDTPGNQERKESARIAALKRQ